MEAGPAPGETQEFTIWQQNTRKSNEAQLATIHSAGENTQLICIQEPYIDARGNSRATRGWHTIYPSTHYKEGAQRSRALILVNAKLSTNDWTQIDIDSPDVAAIQLRGDSKKVNVYCIYVDGEHDEALEALRRHKDEMERGAERRGRGQQRGSEQEEADLWLGDFNRLHPMWEDDANDRLFTAENLKRAEGLLQLLAEYGMEQALAKGTPTIINSHRNYTRPDNIFISGDKGDWILGCDTREEDMPAADDHMPIVTTLELAAETTQIKARRNYRRTDWNKFKEGLERGMIAAKMRQEITNTEELDEEVEKLERVIVGVMDQCVPTTKPSVYMKRWWTKELDDAKRDARRAKGRACRRKQVPDHPAHEDARKTRNRYSNLIKKTKTQHWEEWLDNLNSKTMWDAHKFVKAAPSDGGRTRIPALKELGEGGEVKEVKDNEEKSRMLHRAFFYNPPEDPKIDQQYEYPDPAFEFEHVTQSQIIRVAKMLNPYKAPGMNEIPNAVLVYCAETLAPYLEKIYRATFKVDHYPTKWKRYTTVVLRKQDKPDYKLASTYRPIALLDVLAKLLSACVKENLEHHIERLNLLPERQFGGRPRCTTGDSLHLLMKFTKDAWRRGEEVAVVYMDVKGAFPNTVIPVLEHDMRKVGIPEEYTKWMRNKSEGRETVIAFDDYISPPIAVKNGLDQGCNLAMLSYRIYNAGQIKANRQNKEELSTNYADDAYAAAAGKTMREAVKKVEEIFHREGGPRDWAKSHFSDYQYEKFVFEGLTRRRIADPNNPRKRIAPPMPSINLDGQEIKAKNLHKFLGVMVDSELRFKQHAAHAITKGTKMANQTRRLSRMAKGMRGDYARRVYYSSVVTSMLYAADVWCPTKAGGKGEREKGMKGMLRKMDSVQRRAAIQATGALRTTPTDLLFAHADMPPTKHVIRKMCNAAALRMATLPNTHPLYKEIKRAKKTQPKRHPAPLHHVMAVSRIFRNEFETIETTGKAPNWKSPVHVTIAKDREEAKRMDEEDNSDIKIYTDGSGLGGKIGGAAVLYEQGQCTRVARRHLGSEKEHTVFEGECVGQILGMQLLEERMQEKEMNRATTITISMAVDNQASLTRHKARKQGPGSYLIEEIQDNWAKIKKKHPKARLKMRWVPGHEDIPGSERVDREAKRAAKGPDKNTEPQRGYLKKPLPRSKAAARQELKRRAKKRTEIDFRLRVRYEKIAKIDPTVPSGEYRKICSKLTRTCTSIVTQLRTEHITLNAHLNKIKAVENPNCENCEDNVPETVAHYLKHCKAYRALRAEWKKELGPDVPIGTELLGELKTIQSVLRFVKATKRFEESHGEITCAEKETEEEEAERREEEELEQEENWV